MAVNRDTVSEQQQAELAALADGSLGAERAARLQAEIDASPALAKSLKEQQRSLDLLKATEIDAPAGLRTRIELLAADSTHRRAAIRPFSGARVRLSLAGGLAIAVLVAVLVGLLGGGAGGPTVVQAATLSERPVTLPAPGVETDHPALLTRSEAGVAYPNWQDRFAWRATGARTDSISDRQASTVFYTDAGGRRVGYSILSGAALPTAAGARSIVRNGIRLEVLRHDGMTIVSWLRSGHSCVLSGRGVSASVLEALASWQAGGSVPY